ncbi:hypothetical protein N0V94_008128 [Neodidymelliopsis sp. IMI 364377]|nr:hypothetical protein N0V94_008128 [Neodidymelliopsis sp. IMI 364377]
MCYFFDFGLYFPKVSLVAFYWWLIPIGFKRLRVAVYVIFILPFFIIGCLKLRKRQKIALCGVFSLGLITIIISLARFIVYTVTDYNVDDASGNLWCTAEMCTANIVVSLPALKALIASSSPTNTSYRSTDGYMHAGSSKPLSGRNHGVSRSHVQGGRISDDELELVFQGSRKPSVSPSRSTNTTTGTQDVKDNVMVTTDWSVTTHPV